MTALESTILIVSAGIEELKVSELVEILLLVFELITTLLLSSTSVW